METQEEPAVKKRRTLRPRAPVHYREAQDGDPLVNRAYDVRNKFHCPRFDCDHGFVKHMRGEEFTLQYIQENGFQHPVVFTDPAGLGMLVPPPSFSVTDVKRCVGARREVDVVDTASQESLTMTMQQWVRYYQTLPRKRLLNVISLEFSHTRLAKMVRPPSLLLCMRCVVGVKGSVAYSDGTGSGHTLAPLQVSRLDWVDAVWPRELREAQTDPTNDLHKMMYPKVQKYCLMTVAGCFTDFHLDFGGTSVWYHVLRGKKMFLLVPPSEETYSAFLQWQHSGQQDVVFFADLVPFCQLVCLSPGHTFLMPSGWIHAVYTPVDSLVFGGNFLHSFNIPQQLRVAQMEEDTKVPAKFCYPFYGATYWYALLRYSERLQSLGVGEAGSGGRWLQCVVVRRVSVPGEGRRRRRRRLRYVAVERLPRATRSSQQLEMDSDTSADVSDRSHTDSSVTSELDTCLSDLDSPEKVPGAASPDSKPFLSSYEKEGLLLLVQKMKEEQLFELEAPSCISSPTQLLLQLEAQLHSPVFSVTCSAGTSVLYETEGRVQSAVNQLPRDENGDKKVQSAGEWKGTSPLPGQSPFLDHHWAGPFAASSPEPVGASHSKTLQHHAASEEIPSLQPPTSTPPLV